MKVWEFDPKEEPEELLNPSAYVKYRNGKEISLSELTIREIREAMDLPQTDFFYEEVEKGDGNKG